MGSDVVRLGTMGSDWVISHTHRASSASRTTESDRHLNPNTNPNLNPYLVAVRYGSLAIGGNIR